MHIRMQPGKSPQSVIRTLVFRNADRRHVLTCVSALQRAQLTTCCSMSFESICFVIRRIKPVLPLVSPEDTQRQGLADRPQQTCHTAFDAFCTAFNHGTEPTDASAAGWWDVSVCSRRGYGRTCEG